MTHNALHHIEQLESSLWEAADQLRANSKLTSSEYCMPVLGVIFLRHASNRYQAALKQIEADQAAGKMPQRPLQSIDFKKRRSLMLPEPARYDTLLKRPKDGKLAEALIEAMNAIEEEFEPLRGQLPRDYDKFESDLLENLLRTFDREVLRNASGDVFGRIYEYFLMKFAIQGAQDNGEFFTPPALVQTLVNVIEPDHGIVFDPACGSGGMFVQSSHFIERQGQDTSHKVTFYGQEKTATTIRLTRMNLAVHGLEGDIREANTFYQDEHSLFGRCDFVMANPPFNVDMVDVEKVKGDRRLPFGLPGTTKGAGKKKEGDASKNKETVSNGNYLWISYFWSYLGPKGRAGFVMSSQASSAGHGEAEVRRKIIQTGDVDVMIAIRSNFFYTRTVPCELWHFDKGKPAERRDTVLMLDARTVYRKVTRKIYDFSPEQLANLTAIVWLYRGQPLRFLALVRDYFATVCQEAAAVPGELERFETTFKALQDQLAEFMERVKALTTLTPEQQQPLTDGLAELAEARYAYDADRAVLLKELAAFRDRYATVPLDTNTAQHTARHAFEPLATRIKGLVKQVDLLYKLAARCGPLAQELAALEEAAEFHDRRLATKRLKQLEEARKQAVEQLKAVAYFHRQIVWLQDRFPNAEMQAVPGLCKVVTRADIEAADWSLTPGRYVGVAPPEVDEDFDFEQTFRDIHVELMDLNREAVELAAKIAQNFEELI
ncbi:type I restriction-modification system subunit M [Candidatus Contendibacter odensensis]|uniref:site-specific DNA-methyltransferase (adenine-specific) n=1 Tax=Candidatus Contendobacter odensis Run_B_J11 TaxID=1400861 RepID=A0A7U7GE42_9GAMM|nr:class I SAM-dependent DNA methyltransferase [Candidatus Contendobacter odensis]CDH46395.1 Site-specific DNA-methyltransferase (Adenine-specific) [Candidatus Contendobacter odensis Run_B_J11]